MLVTADVATVNLDALAFPRLALVAMGWPHALHLCASVFWSTPQIVRRA